jgi:sugar phosphate isomerase/epimerase
MPQRTARELGPDDLVLSHFSLMRAGFEERLDAAAAAGFAGIGLLIGEYERLRGEGRTDAELRAELDRRGLVLAEIEVLSGWGQTGEPRERARVALESACRMGEVFGARHMQVIGPYEGSLDDAGGAFAEVCDRAGEVGLWVALEFVPINNIADAPTAVEIIRKAGRPNGGLCLDTWHHFRCGEDEAALPPGAVVSVQLNDGPLVPEDPDYFTDTTQNRRLFGDGEFDFARFRALLDSLGADGPRSIEVISRTLGQLPADEAAKRMFQSARAAGF